MNRIVCIFILLLTLNYSCTLSFRNKRNQPTFGNKEIINEKHPIIIIVKGETLTTESDIKRIHIPNWLCSTKMAYENSKLFSKVHVVYATEKNNKFDEYINAEVNIKHNHSGVGLKGCISILLMGLIPFTSSEEIIISTSFKNNKGEIIKEYSESEKIKNWHQTFLFLAWPFRKSCWEIRREVLYDLNMYIIGQAKKDDIF